MAMFRTPSFRAFSTKAIPTSSVIQNPAPVGPHCVYVLKALTPKPASRSMSSTSPSWFGFTRPWSISRLEPSIFSTIARVAAASSMVSGSPSRVDGTKERTMMSVSESRNTSLMNSLGPMHWR
jgi:hypothetical protein